MRYVIPALLLSLPLACGAEARSLRSDPSLFSHAPCSVLSDEPCNPSVCSALDHRPCLPEIDYPYGENLQLTIVTNANDGRPDEAGEKMPEKLNSLRDLFTALRACWQPPPPEEARTNMQMTVRMSFKHSGAIFAAPQVTFASPGSPADVRDRYRNAIANSLSACAPLPFSAALGGAVAGRPILVRYVETRHVAHPGAKAEP